MSEQTFDLVVLGSGPGGYVAAIRAGQLGLRTALVEKDPYFGGTCLHRGCIPTKAFLQTASLFEQMSKAGEFGVDLLVAPRFDGSGAKAYRDRVVDKNAKGVAYLLKKNGVQTFHGLGSFDPSARRVLVHRDTEIVATLDTHNVLVATGSVPRELPFAPTDGELIINSDHALRIERLPESALVLGAGAVGCEFASIYASLGVHVTLVELLPSVLPLEDEDVQVEAARAFKKRGIEVRTATRLASVDRGQTRVSVKLEPAEAATGGGADSSETSGRAGPSGQSESASIVTVDQLLVAVGRQPVTRGLGLEAAGVQVDDGGYVTVDEWMQTTAPGVFAIGDVVRTPWLAHVASAEGILVAEKIAGVECRPIDYDLVPSCTYCEPEVASVGLTEREARARGYEVECGKFPFSALAKAAILGKTGGFVKVVRETRYDQLLGVHIVGPHATDLIAEACVALRVESTTEELFRTMHAHPTLSEAVAEAAQVALGRALHT